MYQRQQFNNYMCVYEQRMVDVWERRLRLEFVAGGISKPLMCLFHLKHFPTLLIYLLYKLIHIYYMDIFHSLG